MQSKTAQPDLSAAFSELAHENNGKNAEKLPVYMEMLNYFKHIVVQIYLVPYAVAHKTVRAVRTCIPWISRLILVREGFCFAVGSNTYDTGTGTVPVLEKQGIPYISFCFTRLNFLPGVLYLLL
jgi:hypothetical protein